MGNFAKQLRKYPEIYPEEYDRLQAKGRFERTAEENVRYRLLREEIRKASKKRRFEVAVAEAVAAQVVPTPPAPEPDELPPEPRGVVPPAATDAGSQEVEPPPTDDSEPAPLGADDGTERPPIPPAEAPPDPMGDELRRAKALAFLLAPVELGKWEKTAVVAVGVPAVYGPPFYRAHQNRKKRRAAPWTARRPASAPERAPEQPVIVTSESTPEPPPFGSETDSASPSSSPAGTGSSGPSSSPA